MKKGKKRLLLGWICLLLSLCMVTVASAETDGTPIQPCHQVTMTERKSTAQNGASISVWHITTALGTVDAELNALAETTRRNCRPCSKSRAGSARRTARSPCVSSTAGRE